MDPIEKAIRTALEKGDADDPDFRDRVYRSVSSALDRAIQAHPQLTVEKAINRRKALQKKIEQIESEFAPALPAEDAAGEGSLDDALLDILDESAPPAPSAVPPQMPEWPSFGDRRETSASRQPGVNDAPAQFSPRTPPLRANAELDPGFQRTPRPDFRIDLPSNLSPSRPVQREPEIDMGALPSVPSLQDRDFPGDLPPPIEVRDLSEPPPAASPEIAAVDRRTRSRERKRPFVPLFIGVALLSILAFGFVFAFQTGLLKSPEERDSSVHNPPAELPSEDFDPSAGSPPALTDQPPSQQAWITVFSPSNPANASAPGGAKAEAMQDETGTFLRIQSGSSGAAVTFDVGQGVLQQLVGKTAVFNITARAAEGNTTEMSIECNFGEAGDCGRKRYEVDYEKGDYLFEVKFPDTAPGSSGTIAINSDFSGEGKSVDIYEIRAAVQ